MRSLQTINIILFKSINYLLIFQYLPFLKKKHTIIRPEGQILKNRNSIKTRKHIFIK